MPILDPSLQCSLVKNFAKNANCKANGVRFFLKYLRVASRNLNLNQKTIETSILFKRDLQSSIPFINNEFGCRFTIEKDFKNQNIINYYKYFDNQSFSLFQKKGSIKLKGTYHICGDKFQMKYFHPEVFYPDLHAWLLTDTPIAILSINCENIKKQSELENIFKIIKLEIDLMAASGFTLVLCANCVSITVKLLFQLIIDNQFSEIHFNIFNKEDMSTFLAQISHFEGLESFIYSYLHYSNDKIPDQISRFEYFSFIEGPVTSLTDVNITRNQPFSYCQTGFKNEFLRIRLSNVPIYESNDESDIIPSQINNNLSIGYILSSDFLKWRRERIQILFDDIDENRNIFKYIEFDDIHFINPNLYVKNTLFLMNIDEKNYKEISKIKKSITTLLNKNEMPKNQNNKTKILNDTLIYIVHSYFYLMKSPRLQDSFFFNLYKELQTVQDENKFIFKIDGIGKTNILIITAAFLALTNKTVHIMSKNIAIAKRDFSSSYEFFKYLGLTSSILINYDQFSSDEKFFKRYDEQFYQQNVFNNQLRMNFCVCGIKNDSTTVKSKANIVFSILPNFECIYFQLMEQNYESIDAYFNECILLVDEPESILVDEMLGSTILEQKTEINNKKVLQMVYEQYCQRETVEHAYRYILNNLPEIQFNIDDIREMYKDIKIVENFDFENGKKYIIKSMKVNKMSIKNKILNEVKEEEKDLFEANFVVLLDDKGNLQPNKKMEGFIHQFIKIKESFKNNTKNVIIDGNHIKELEISHYMFFRFYNRLYGYTKSTDINIDYICKKFYGFKVMKLPSKSINLNINLPIIFCKCTEKHIMKIASEVFDCYQKQNPVIVIFKDMNSLYESQRLLYQYGIKRIITLFNTNKDSLMKIELNDSTILFASDDINDFCIHFNTSKYTHIIYTFKPSNLLQLKNATYRIICFIQQYFIKPPNIKINQNDVHFDIKHRFQQVFFHGFKKSRPWIFVNNFGKQKLSSQDISILNKSKINVNFNTEPECECSNTVKDFLDVQLQRIISLKNAPSVKCALAVFQNYVHDMIYGSWSIMIDTFDKINDNFDYNQYEEKLSINVEHLNLYLTNILSNSLDKKRYEIIPTFMSIYMMAVSFCEKKLIDSTKMMKIVHISIKPNMSLGFKYFSIPQKLTINPLCNIIYREFCMIMDNFCKFDILKFFMNTTLTCYQFCMCFDIKLVNDLIDDCSFLFDKDPLLTLFVNSDDEKNITKYLIILIIYCKQLNKKITEFFVSLPKKIDKFVITDMDMSIRNAFIEFLTKIVDNQIKNMDDFSHRMANNMKLLYSIFTLEIDDGIDEKIMFSLGKSIKVKSDFKNKFKNNDDFLSKMKIEGLIFFCFASLILRFGKDSIEFQSSMNFE